MNAGTPTKLVFTSTVSGNQAVSSSANVGPFQVQVQDAFNNPVTNANAAATVTLLSSSTGTTFFTTTSGGTIASAVTIANNSSSSPSFYYADTKAGSPMLTASATINGTHVSGTTNGFTMTAGSGSKVAFVQQPTTTTAGNAINPGPTVQVQDSFGNAVPGSGVTVTMTVNSGPGAFTGGSTTSTTTNAAGLATFSNLILDTSGSYTIQAASTGLGTVNSNAFTVNGKATVASLVISAISSPQTAGSGFTVTVTGFDSFGNQVNNSSDSIRLGIAAGSPQSTFSNTGATTMTATLNNGMATFNGVTFDTAGSTYALTASDTTVSVSAPSSNTFTVNPGTASKLAFSQQPTTTTAGNAINPGPTVQVEDSFGNAVADSGATMTMTVNSGPGGFTGSTTSTTTNAGGLATFSNLVLNTSGSYTIRAASTGLGNVTSNSFTVNPGSAVKVAFVQQPTTTTAGSAINPGPTVQVEDTFGNAVPGSGVTVTMSANGFSFTGGSTISANTNAAGLATFNNLATNTAGSGYTLTAASSGLGNVNSNSFTVNAGTPTKLVFTSTVSGNHPVTSSANVGAFVVQAQDNFGNPVTNTSGVSATVSLSSSSTGTTFFTTTPGGSSALAVRIANTASSSPSFYYADTQAGSPTITASATINGTPVSGTTNGFTMTPGSASKVGFVQQPTTTTAGNAISPAPTVQVQDSFGNAVTDSGATVTMSVNSGPGAFTGGSTTSTTTNAAGLATFSNLVLNTSGSYTIQAASSGLGTANSGSFTVNAAGANKLVFVQQPGKTVSGHAISPAPTVQVEDTFGNAVADNGATVTMSINSGPGGFTGSTTSTTTNAGGLATFSNLVINTTGAYTIKASSAGLTSATSTSFNVINPVTVSQSTPAQGSGTSTTATLGSTPSSGTTLIVLVYTETNSGAAVAPSSINGSAVSGSSLITSTLPGGAGSHYGMWAYSVSSSGTGARVTVNFAASQAITEVDVMALSGNSNATPVSQTNTGTSATPIATLPAAPAAGDLEVAFFGTAGRDSSLTLPVTGWTNVGSLTGMSTFSSPYGEGSFYTNTNGSTSQTFNIGRSVAWATIALDIGTP